MHTAKQVDTIQQQIGKNPDTFTVYNQLLAIKADHTTEHIDGFYN